MVVGDWRQQVKGVELPTNKKKEKDDGLGFKALFCFAAKREASYREREEKSMINIRQKRDRKKKLKCVVTCD